MKAGIDSLEVKGRRVLVREDLNVPSIADDTRIRAALPTLQTLVERGAKVIVLSHLGRPKGKPDPQYSLRPVSLRLAELLGQPVAFAEDCVGPAAVQVVGQLHDGQVALLENVRFHPGEEANDPAFAAQLAALGDVYVNDAFAASHRAHASVVGLAEYLPAYAGLLMQAELTALSAALEKPRRPLVAIVAGAKVSTKAGVLRFLLPKVDKLLIGGAMANTFNKAAGRQVGASLVEDEALDEANKVAELAGEKLVLPIDGVCARAAEAGESTEIFPAGQIPSDWKMLDIGPQTVKLFAEQVSSAGTVVWNGPVGVAEIPEFANGTRQLGEAIVASHAYSLVGGGDTAAAVAKLGLSDRFDHVSTGGGATLEYLEGKVLPGVAILREAVSV